MTTLLRGAVRIFYCAGREGSTATEWEGIAVTTQWVYLSECKGHSLDGTAHHRPECNAPFQPSRSRYESSETRSREMGPEEAPHILFAIFKIAQSDLLGFSAVHSHRAKTNQDWPAAIHLPISDQ